MNWNVCENFQNTKTKQNKKARQPMRGEKERAGNEAEERQMF